MELCKKMIAVICICTALALSAVSSYAAAQQIEGIPVNGEIQISPKYNLVIQDDCSEHTHFQQATASENGWFAVHYVSAINKQSEDELLGRMYVDIFDDSGVLYKEISLETSSNRAIKLTEKSLLIILYDELLVYDLKTDEMHAYRISAGYGNESGLFSELNSRTFRSGAWTYQCKNSLQGYTELTRTDGKTQQTLLDLPGSGLTIWNSAVPALTIGLLGCLLGHRLRKKKKNTRADSLED